MKCELCKLKRITYWHPIVSDYWNILDCKTCKIPMLVLKRHSMKPTNEELNEAILIQKRYFPNLKFRTEQRKIKNHLHWHLI